MSESNGRAAAILVTLPGEAPRSFATARGAICWLLRQVGNDELGRVALQDVHAESLRRTVGLPGPDGAVGAHVAFPDR